MQLRTLGTEERAVSSVVSTMLMIAVVVILATIIGNAVLGLGAETTETGPSASISIESGTGYDDGQPAAAEDGLTIAHQGGDAVPRSTLGVVVGGRNLVNPDGSINHSIDGLWNPADNQPGNQANEPTDPWESGEAYVFVENANGAGQTDDTLVQDGDVVRVVWTSPTTDQTATLARDTVDL